MVIVNIVHKSLKKMLKKSSSEVSINDTIWYISELQLGSHPVAVLQYTFTRK
jgi:hypothetical protein